MRRLSQIFLTMAILCLGVTVAFAQQGTTGEIRGIITDEQGAAVVGAKVLVKNMGTGIERTVMSDERGRYRALLLPVGQYEVTVEKESFKKWQQTGITVQVGDLNTLNIRLEVGEFSSVVTLTGDAAVIETTRTSVSAVVGEKYIDNLPINGRDYRDFVLITPTTSVSDRNGVTIGGSRGMYTNLTVDGADNNSAFFGEQNGGEIDPSFTVSQESVKEFRVLNAGFNAEFGRSIGGLINVVTKSGTNDLRGTGFFYMQNESMVADQADDSNFGEDKIYIEQKEFKRYQFGGSIGGPIVEDKAFFFLSADLQQFEQPNQIRFTFSDAVRAANPDIAAMEGEYISTNDNIVVFGKVDYQLNEDHSLSVRFNYSKADQENGLGYFADNALSQQGKEEESTTSTVGTLTSFLGEDMINELRVQYATNNVDRVNNEDSTEIRVSGVGRWGGTWYLPITIDINRWQISDNFNWLMGDHDLKFGFDWNRNQTDEIFIGYSRGYVQFNSLAAYRAGTPASALQKVPLNGKSMDESGAFEFTGNNFAVYAQDKWQPTDQLTLDLGLRWEGTYNPEPPNPNPLFPLTGQLYDDTDNWMPRVGVAYDVFGTGKTVVRAAGGVFYGVTASIVFANVWFNNGQVGVVQFLSGSQVPWPYNPQDVIDSISAAGAGLDIDYADPNYQEARTYRVNFGVEQELIPDTSLSVDFLWADGENLMRRTDTNFAAPIPGAALNGRDLYSRSTRPNKQFGRLTMLTSAGEMEYMAVTAMLKSRIEDINLQASYTWSEDKDDDSNERSSGGVTYSEPFKPEADYGLSDRDRTHRFVVSAVYNAPWDINVSGILTYMSGRPYSAVWGIDLNGDGQTTDRAEPGSGGTVWAERNTYRVDEYANFDMRISKSIRFDRYEIEGIFEAFNLFNWESPTAVYTTSRFTSFGLTTAFQDSRRFQVGARFRF